MWESSRPATRGKTLIVLTVTTSQCMFALARLDLSCVMTETAQGEPRAAPTLTIFGPVLLTGFGGTAFGTTGDVVQDLLSTTAVHPMREDAALALLAKNHADRAVLDRLVAENLLKPVTYRDHVFYVRRLA